MKKDNKKTLQDEYTCKLPDKDFSNIANLYDTTIENIDDLDSFLSDSEKSSFVIDDIDFADFENSLKKLNGKPVKTKPQADHQKEA